MFIRGEETWETLLNLIKGFRRHSTSHLAAALLADLDLYRQHADEPEPPPADPDWVEESPELGALKTVIELLQGVIQRGVKTPKITKMPRPKTARDLLMAENTRTAFAKLEASFKFVPNNEFERTLKAHGGQAVVLDGLNVHRRNGDTGRRPIDAGVPQKARGGSEDDQPHG